MKLILILLLTSTALRAQVPHIDYMIADEAKSQLQIHGTFGPDHTGGATIEGVPCSVRFWSDTMVICDLPDSGAGSGGHVIVQQMSGTSNARMLSIFKMTILSPLYYYQAGTIPYFIGDGSTTWNLNWRADIYKRPKNISQIIPFEISKSSLGEWVKTEGNLPYPDIKLSWSDSIHISDTTITLFGELDLLNFKIIFKPTQIQSTPSYTFKDSIPFMESYLMPTLSFDSNGFLSSYKRNDTTFDVQHGSKEIHADGVFNQKILFPPRIKNSVTQSPLPCSDPIKIFSHIGSEDHSISLEAEGPLGETTASLYSIEGRLLKQEKISIPQAGMYSFDVSGINARMGFLVFKTEKGIVARKVVF